MIPRLVPEILPLDAFCDRVAGVVGIGDSRSWMAKLLSLVIIRVKCAMQTARPLVIMLFRQYLYVCSCIHI